MRKYNEGYALVLVVAILALLCVLGTFIISFAVRNLQGQVSSVTQMQERYTAQGEIEKIVASLEALIGQEEGAEIVLNSSNENLEIRVLEDDSQDESTQIEITSVCGSVKIFCTLELKCDEFTLQTEIGAEAGTYYVFNLTDVSYASYWFTITATGGDEA